MNILNWLIQSVRPVLDSIDQPITAIDSHGRFVYYNQASARMDGTDASEVIGQYILDVNTWLAKEESTLLQCLKDQKQRINNYQSFQSSGGVLVNYLHSVTPIFSNAGKLLGAIEIGRAVNEIPKSTNQTGQKKPPLPSIITSDAGLKQEIVKLDIFARSELPLILHGETGTGKELFAQRAHALSARSTRPMININCAAIPETLLESTLFGTMRGAYTGAENRKGLFSLTNGGTLFLDEINSMPTSLQSKLLRVLQDGYYLPVGAITPEHTDTRIIAAMNQSPQEAIQEGRLRKDLYYRLNIGEVYIPPLHARPDDIVLLSKFFISKLAPELRPEVTTLNVNAIHMLLNYSWPGNVRELQNAIARSLLLHDKGPQLKNIILSQQHPHIDKAPYAHPTSQRNLNEQLHVYEDQIIERTLKKYQGNITAAAAELGIPRTTLNSKIKNRNLLSLNKTKK